MAKRTTKTTKKKLREVTSSLNEIKAVQSSDSDRQAALTGTVDVVAKKISMITGILARNAARVKTLEQDVDSIEERLEQQESVQNAQAEVVDKPSLSIVSAMESIASSFALVNRSLGQVAEPDPMAAYQAEALQGSKPSVSTTPGAPAAAGGGGGEGGVFGLLKSLFTNPAVVAALAGIVYTILPKDVQDKIKAFLGGFIEGISDTTGKDENSGIKGLGTALKIAAGVIATIFSAKLIGGVISAITTTIQIFKAMRKISGKKLLAVGAGVAAGALLMGKKGEGGEEEDITDTGEGTDTKEGAGGAKTEAKPVSEAKPAPAATPTPAPAPPPAATPAPPPPPTTTPPAPSPSTPASAPPTATATTKPAPAATSGTPSTTNAPAGGRFKSPRDFHTVMMPWAEYSSQKLGGKVPPMAIMGQWAGESGNGSALSADYNYAGIKAGSKYQKGDFVPTEERYTDAQLKRAQEKGEELLAVLGPNDKIRKKGRDVTVDQWFGKGAWQKAKDAGLNWVQVKSYFAKFRDLKDFADSYVEFLKAPRYAKAIGSTTAAGFGYEVAKAGYATASADTYGAKVAAYSAPSGSGSTTGAGTALAAAPVSPAPTTGTAIATASQNVKTASQPTTQIASVSTNKTTGMEKRTQTAQAPIPSPSASRGSLLQETRHSSAYA